VLIEARDVAKSYAKGAETVQVLRDIDLDVAAGEWVALMGPSGSGKTTLLNLLGGLDVPDEGSIRVAGEELSGRSNAELAAWRARHVGFIFQLYNLLPVLTAYQNVELPLLLTPLSRKERREHVATALHTVGLADRMDHYPSQLSGGQQQRQLDVLIRGQHRQQIVELEDEPDVPRAPRGEFRVGASEQFLAVDATSWCGESERLDWEDVRTALETLLLRGVLASAVRK